MIRRHVRARPKLQPRSRARARIRAALVEPEGAEVDEARAAKDAPIAWAGPPLSAASSR